MSSPLTLRRLLAVALELRTSDQGRRALGLETEEQLWSLITKAARAGATSIDRELEAQTPAEVSNG